MSDLKLQKVRSRLIQYRVNQGEGGKPLPWHLLAQRIIESPTNELSIPNDEQDFDPATSKIDAGWPITGERLRVFASPKSTKSRLKSETEQAVIEFLLAEGALIEEELLSNEVEVIPITSLLKNYLGIDQDQTTEMAEELFSPIMIDEDGYQIDCSVAFGPHHAELSGWFKMKPGVIERDKDMILYFNGWLINFDEHAASGYMRGANEYLRLIGDLFVHLKKSSATGFGDSNLHLRDITHHRTINLRTDLSGN
ncbi:hypothetical protein L2D01_05355 [Hyphomonadaceae bacterium ML37]|nr:hypothetical protein L2D01_05355 [Hyphomonadaceae bacterium ML37]